MTDRTPSPAGTGSNALALRPLSVGEILDRAFQIYRRNFAIMYVLALVATLPSALYILLAHPTTSGARATPAVDWYALAVSWGLGAFVGPFVWSALVTVVDGMVQAQPIGLGGACRRGLRAILPLLGASLLLLLACTAVTVPVGIVAFIVAVIVALVVPKSSSTTLGVGITIVLVAGLLLALVPFGATIAFLLTPVVALERRGMVAALKRGYQLTKGARLRLLGITLIAWGIAFLPSLAIGVVPSILRALRSPSVSTVVAATSSGPWTNIFFAIRLAIAALATPFMVGCSVLAYYDRRVRLEGLDVELASAALERTPKAPA